MGSLGTVAIVFSCQRAAVPILAQVGQVRPGWPCWYAEGDGHPRRG
ncbi:hypothetical protein NKG05_21250 [Oerskovia sp. M15]